MPAGAASPQRFHTDDRDEALVRVRRTTRWVLASAALGTGVLVGVVAHELPAHSTSATGTGGTSGTSGTSPSGTSTGSATSLTSTGATPAGTSTAGASTAGVSTTGASTTGSGTSGSPSISQGAQQPAHAATGQS
ncbi:MAG: hypothetical protein ACRDZR_03020 [Acidimicrobiales bacterium]